MNINYFSITRTLNDYKQNFLKKNVFLFPRELSPERYLNHFHFRYSSFNIKQQKILNDYENIYAKKTQNLKK